MDNLAAPLMLSVSGCRGIVGASLTPEVVARFAGSFGGWLVERAGAGGAGGGVPRRPKVVLGRDGRAGGLTVRDAAAAGLAAAGCDVIDLGIAMTPTVGVMTDRYAAAGGMVITASHNPQAWNGLKCLVREARAGIGSGGGGGGGGRAGVADACAPSAELAGQIIERFRTVGPRLVAWNALGRTEREGGSAALHAAAAAEAVERATGALQLARQRRFRVVVDSVNASGAEGAADLLRSFGCDIIHLGDEPTGLFAHPPEPTRENLASVCEAVRASRADVGFAQDPDADRLAIIDERGEYIGEEHTLALSAEAVLECGGVKAAGAVLATNLSTSRMIDDVAARHGARVVRTAVGEANVVAAMKREGSPVGGEGNGGVIFPAVTYIRDSLSAMGLVLALMARAGRPLSQIVGRMPAYAIEKRKVDLPDTGRAAAAVEAVAAAYSGERLDRQDGVRVDFDARRAWLHVRASNTEPIMRLIAEAPTAEAAREILDETARVIG